MNRYFVTGGTGVVGSALVPRLLEQPDTEVWLLVRAPDGDAMRERVDSLFVFWDLGAHEASARQRVHALRGDATEPRFGLAEAEYEGLLAGITHVIHAAGAVRMNLPIEQARKSACGSARQVLELARRLHEAGRLHKLEFVSTVGVGGRTASVPERWIDEPRSFHNTYEQSKAEAEELVRDASASGLPVTVHRPSMVVGDSRSGRIRHFQVFYHLCEFLSGRRTLGLYPPLDGQSLDLVPSDLVAGVLAWSSRREDLAGRILHVCAGPAGAVPLPLLRERVRGRMAARGTRLPPVVKLSAGLFTRLLALAGRFVDARSRRALATLPVFLDYLASHQAFENDHTRALLQGRPDLQAAPWQHWLDRVVDHYLDARGS